MRRKEGRANDGKRKKLFRLTGLTPCLGKTSKKTAKLGGSRGATVYKEQEYGRVKVAQE